LRCAERPTGLIWQAGCARGAPTRLPAPATVGGRRSKVKAQGWAQPAARCGGHERRRAAPKALATASRGTPLRAAGPLPGRWLPQPPGEGTPLRAAGPLPRRSLPQPPGEGTPLRAAGPLPRRWLPQPPGEGTAISGAARPASLAGQCRHPSSCLSNVDRHEANQHQRRRARCCSPAQCAPACRQTGLEMRATSMHNILR